MIHMYITNDTKVAKIAEKYGVERIWVDLETLGKDVRQFSYNSVKSSHSVSDIRRIKDVLTSSQILVRVNPWHTFAYGGYNDSYDEINAVVKAGADLIMLPMWKTVDEVKNFVQSVNRRARTVLLLETKEADDCLDEIIALYEEGTLTFDEIHIGLNDLHISYGLDFMFELLSNGSIERICSKIRKTDIPYGFGGVAKIGDGAIPAEKILMEHYRLGSSRVILSRTFCDNAIIDDIDEIDRVFRYNMKRLRDYEDAIESYTDESLLSNKSELAVEIGKVADNIWIKKENIRLHTPDKIKTVWDGHLKNPELESSFYLLDIQQFENNYIELKKEFSNIYPHFNIAYSYKTNYIPSLCKSVNYLGGYAEVVSEIEMEMALRCGVPAERIIWNGPIKNNEISERLIVMGGQVNVDTPFELEILTRHLGSDSGRPHDIGIRCNFDIGDKTVSRFGIDVNSDDFKKAIHFFKTSGSVKLKSLQCHYADRRLDFWPERVQGMIKIINLVKNELGYIPERIDFGGGLYGKMPQSLSGQFSTKIPTYQEYAECLQEFSRVFPEYRPELLIEPGSALVGDCMKYITRVESVKTVRGKQFITVNGSQKNINMSGVNPPIEVLHNDKNKDSVNVQNCDIVGYTCIENDVLYKGYNGEIAIGDYIVFGNCGSYSIVMKPPFIIGNCPVYEIRGDKISLIKRQEYFDDIFHTYLF